MINLGNDWDEYVQNEAKQPYYLQLRQFLKQEYATKTIYPPMADIFAAPRHTSYAATKVVILGQDPYINPGEAHGMAFSVSPAAKVPPSLRNIFKEIEADIGHAPPNNGYLMPWATQGVLLLNTVLTVQAGQSKSHAGKGWEVFTNAIIARLTERRDPLVFMLWGKAAQEKAALISQSHHLVLTAAHPSPLAGGKFFGCRHFSRANEFLTSHGEQPIDWQIPNL